LIVVVKYSAQMQNPAVPAIASPRCRPNRDVKKYEFVVKIGQGTFGEVFKAKDKQTGKVVALKKVILENEKEGFPITALREIKILKLLNHENVVKLIEICHGKPGPLDKGKAKTYLVFEYAEHDLAGLLSNINLKFTQGEIKKVIFMLLEGLFYIHRNKILHRDMKAANILITKEGVLKLADFGLARAFSVPDAGKTNRYTNRVVTLWYRPPELLLGERNYGPMIDMWGAGCIFAEMYTRTPIMQGQSESSQLRIISQLCGSINTDVWPDVAKYDLYHRIELPKNLKRHVVERLSSYVRDPEPLLIINRLLALDPKKRMDSDEALNHDFFYKDPMPSNLDNLMSQVKTSMYEYTAAPRKVNNHQQIAAVANNRNHPYQRNGRQQPQQQQVAGGNSSSSNNSQAVAAAETASVHVDRIF